MKFDVPNRSEFVLQEHEGVEGGGGGGGIFQEITPAQVLDKF